MICLFSLTAIPLLWHWIVTLLHGLGTSQYDRVSCGFLGCMVLNSILPACLSSLGSRKTLPWQMSYCHPAKQCYLLQGAAVSRLTLDNMRLTQFNSVFAFVPYSGCKLLVFPMLKYIDYKRLVRCTKYSDFKCVSFSTLTFSHPRFLFHAC